MTKSGSYTAPWNLLARWKWLQVVLADRPLNGAAKSVAGRLAEHASAQTGHAWPSQDRLAEDGRPGAEGGDMIDNPDGVSRALHCREPLFIFETEAPAGVLSGIVITDWYCWLSFWVEGCSVVVCESYRLAHCLRACLRAEGLRPMPEIRVMEARHAA